MRIETAFVDGVQVGQRHRSINPERVAALAESMREIGLQTPITVYAPDDDTHLLVAGLHRLEAAKKLGWETIPVFFVNMDETERELWEISENLHRADLTKEERDRQIRRYAELLEKRRTEVADAHCATHLDSVGRRKSPQQMPGIASQIARETGLHKSTINRALSPPSPKAKTVVEVMSDEELDHAQFEAACRYVDKLRPGARKLLRDYLI